ncbi:hypothetical protein [Nucisporomicrobium flavum]|uniref:hypothetical protein n=1 Tax=Nucisporomicrobium flavum TaxID=2785915 RepID=UPI0018F33316|nr:hypothetical protein [Nucisporomicrobium flavum]
MDNAMAVNGPYPATPTVRYCDIGDHRLSPGQPWYLVTSPSRDGRQNKAATCATHLPDPDDAGQGRLYRVGDLFDPGRTSWPQGPHLWLDTDGDTRLAIFLTEPSRREISAIESGIARFAWTEQNVNGFLLFKYGDSPWNDAPFNPQRLSEPFDGRPVPRGTHSRTFTFLVHADTGRIAAMRMFTWPAYFLNHVVDSVHRLATRPYHEAQAHAAQQDFYRRYPDGPSLYRLVRTLPPHATCTGGQREDRPH